MPADPCPRCQREPWDATTPKAFDPSVHCLARSGAQHQVAACERLELGRLRVENDQLRRQLATVRQRALVTLIRARNEISDVIDVATEEAALG